MSCNDGFQTLVKLRLTATPWTARTVPAGGFRQPSPCCDGVIPKAANIPTGPTETACTSGLGAGLRTSHIHTGSADGSPVSLNTPTHKHTPHTSTAPTTNRSIGSFTLAPRQRRLRRRGVAHVEQPATVALAHVRRCRERVHLGRCRSKPLRAAMAPSAPGARHVRNHRLSRLRRRSHGDVHRDASDDVHQHHHRLASAHSAVQGESNTARPEQLL